MKTYRDKVMENIITVNNDTDLHQLGIDLIAESLELVEEKAKNEKLFNIKTLVCDLEREKIKIKDREIHSRSFSLQHIQSINN